MSFRGSDDVRESERIREPRPYEAGGLAGDSEVPAIEGVAEAGIPRQAWQLRAGARLP